MWGCVFLKIRFRKIYFIAVIFLVVLMTKYILVENVVKHTPEFSENLQKFRKFNIDGTLLEELKEQEKRAEYLSTAFLYGDGKVSQKVYLESRGSLFSYLLPASKEKPYIKAIQTVIGDIEYFPIPLDQEGGVGIRFEDSWGNARNYGGSRKHEGCDIMPENNESGYFPVLSISDGVIEKKGWLELGGYRIGIRAPGGAFFYYAHLDSYEPGLNIGDMVSAGQTLGYMGNSGYGEEGTKGKFDVHLHFGVYMDIDGKEVSINPYQILKYLENYRKTFYRNQEV